MKKIVVLTGAGMSAESGISTFRDAGGLWEKHKVEDVCTPQALENNLALVLKFYNERRDQLLKSSPNKGHRDLVKLEEKYDVQIITQNVDNLHEKAGSSKVLHLHGELMKVRSTGDESLIYDLDETNLHTKIGDKCEKGFQLRPHIVFFGEAVPNIEKAAHLCAKADIMLIIGTSLQVYPAAGLMAYAPSKCPIYYVDPRPTITTHAASNLTIIEETASKGVEIILKKLFK